MITDLEKQFFDTFGIEPKEFKSCDVGTFCPYPEKECGTDTCPYYRTYKVDYPAITDRILLELICILTKRFDYADQNWLTKCNDTKELKVSVLRLLLLCPTRIIDEYKNQVQTLFKGQ